MSDTQLRVGLEFAPGTTDDCKRLIGQLFKPGDILGAYRQARGTFKTGDIVLVTDERDPSGFEAQTRLEYVKKLRLGLGLKAAKMMRVLTIAHKSAHAIMSLPFESEAFWLVIIRGPQVPVMAVLYVTPYEVGAEAVN